MSGYNNKRDLEAAVREAVEALPVPRRCGVQFISPHVEQIVPDDVEESTTGGTGGVLLAPPPIRIRPFEIAAGGAGAGPSARPRTLLRAAKPLPPAPPPSPRNEREHEMRHPDRPRYSFVKPFSNLCAEFNPWTALRTGLNVGTSVVSGVFSATGWPVVAWMGVPYFLWGVNDVVSFARFKPEENPMLAEYYSKTNFTNSLLHLNASGENTRSYFGQQLTYEAGIAGLATAAVGTGHFPSTHFGAWAFNSAANLAPTFSPLVQITEMLRLRNTYSDDDELQVWIKWIVGLKVARVPYRAFLLTLPSSFYAPSAVLAALAAYGGMALMRGWLIGHHIEALAQYMHFRAFDEQGWLARANDYIAVSDPARRPFLELERSLTNVIHPFTADAGPASSTIKALFSEDIRRHVSATFLGDLVREPCGWMAIAHKISQL